MGGTPGLNDLMGLSMMNPEDGSDSTRRLMQMMMLSRISGGAGPSGAPSTTPNPTTTTTTDSSTGRLYTGEILPPSPASSVLDSPSQASALLDRIHPKGFDDTGMPTEFPSTQRANDARATLQRTMHPPHALRNALILGGLGTLATALAARHGNTFAGAGAAQGFQQGENLAYQRHQTDINRAQSQYEFEAGQEERQREAALRERVAMTQIESQRAYRDLLIAMRERGQDVTTRGQDIRANLAGFDVSGGPRSASGAPGTPTLTPKSVDELPEIQQARIAAQTELTKLTSQKEAGGLLNQQTQHWAQANYNAKVMGIEAMKELRQQQIDLGWSRMEAPTQSIRSMGETAATVLPHIEELRGLIQEAESKGLLGPIRGRVSQFLAGKIGSTGNKDIDSLLGRLRSADSLMSSALLRTHFGARGGQGLYDKFINLLDTGKSTPEALNGTLDEFKSYAEGYAQAGGVDLANFNAGGAATYNPGLALRRNPVSTSAPVATPTPKGSDQLQRNKPPKGAKVIEWNDLH